MREHLVNLLFIIILILAIAGFIYNYSIDSNSTECTPFYLTGDCLPE